MNGYVNKVAASKMVIARPYSYATIKRAMVAYTQKHSKSIMLHRVQGYNGGKSYIEVVLYNTVILRYWENSKIEVNAGSEYTKMTLMYLNEWLQGVAYVNRNGQEGWSLIFNGIEEDFFNNMTLNLITGKIEGTRPDFEKRKAYNSMIERLIKQWVKRIPITDLPRLIKYAICEEGECFHCDYESSGETEHLLKHLEKFEYPGQLFINAYKMHGQAKQNAEWDASLGAHPSSFGGKEQEPYLEPSIKKYVERYLRRRLYSGPITV